MQRLPNVLAAPNVTEIVQGRDATLSLASIGLTVAMSDLYDGIDLPEAPRRRPAAGG